MSEQTEKRRAPAFGLMMHPAWHPELAPGWPHMTDLERRVALRALADRMVRLTDGDHEKHASAWVNGVYRGIQAALDALEVPKLAGPAATPPAAA